MDLRKVRRDVAPLDREAAAIMDSSEAAFKGRLHRARPAVRRSLDEYLQEEGR